MRWVCPYTTVAGPLAGFTSDHEFSVASLDGLVYQCQIDPETAAITVASQMPFLDLEGETVLEGDRNWSSFD